MAERLSDKGLAALKPTTKRTEIADALIPGLYVIVHPSGRKVLVVRYRHHGERRKVTLGAFPAIGLAEARKLAREVLVRVAAGEDPARADRAAAEDEERLRVDVVAEEFHRRHSDRNRTGPETRRIFRQDVLPRWGKRRVDELTRRDVLDLIDAVVDRGAETQANRVLAAVRKWLNWCASRDLIAASPAAGVKPPTKEKSRDRVLSPAELRALWRASGELSPIMSSYVRILIVAGQRRRETAMMEWEEIDLEAAMWVIPPRKAKNGIRHEVPLSRPAVEILRALPRNGTFAFTTTGRTPVSGFSRLRAQIEAGMKRELGEDVTIAPWTLHDLRRTYASGCAALGVPLPVIERALNHVSGSFGGIVGVYQRHAFADERREAMEKWAAHVLDVAASRGR